MSDPEPVFMLIRATGVPAVPSTQVEAGCGCRCWLSANGLKILVDRPDLRTSCMECLGETDESVLARLKAGQAAPITGTKDSMVELFGKAYTESAFRRMHMPPERDARERNP